MVVLFQVVGRVTVKNRLDLYDIEKNSCTDLLHYITENKMITEKTYFDILLSL